MHKTEPQDLRRRRHHYQKSQRMQTDHASCLLECRHRPIFILALRTVVPVIIGTLYSTADEY